jgi:hypothetical protein
MGHILVTGCKGPTEVQELPDFQPMGSNVFPAEECFVARLVLFILGAHKNPSIKKRSRLLGSRLLSWVQLLRSRSVGDGLQTERNDLGTDHFPGDDQLDTAVLLTSFGSIV